MTARKTHAYDSTNANALCGATPRTGAPALDLTVIDADVTCIKCEKLITDFEAEVTELSMDTFGDPDFTETAKLNGFGRALVEHPIVEPTYVGPIASAWASNTSIATRHGLDSAVISVAIDAGYLKR